MNSPEFPSNPENNDSALELIINFVENNALLQAEDKDNSSVFDLEGTISVKYLDKFIPAEKVMVFKRYGIDVIDENKISVEYTIALFYSDEPLISLTVYKVEDEFDPDVYVLLGDSAAFETKHEEAHSLAKIIVEALENVIGLQD